MKASETDKLYPIFLNRRQDSSEITFRVFDRKWHSAVYMILALGMMLASFYSKQGEVAKLGGFFFGFVSFILLFVQFLWPQPVIEATRNGLWLRIYFNYRRSFFVPWQRIRQIQPKRVKFEAINREYQRYVTKTVKAIEIEVIEDSDFRLPRPFLAMLRTNQERAANCITFSSQNIQMNFEECIERLGQLKNAQ